MLSRVRNSATRHVQAAEVVATTPAITRPLLSLRISVTDRCSLRCGYCMPANGVPDVSHEQVLSYEEILRFVCELKARYGLTHVRLTGGEPLVRPEIERLVAMLAEAGISDLALTTNGQQLASMAAPLKQAGLRRINISLDTLSPDTFADITRGGILQKTLAGIAAAHKAGLHPIKLNTVVMRGCNDHEVPDLLQFALEHDCQIRFLELMPIGVAAARFDEGFVSTDEVRGELARKFTLTPLAFDPHETSRNFIAEDGESRSAVVGFISPYSQPFCAGCWRLRLTATGVLIGCLARSEGVPIAPLLRSDRDLDVEALAASVERALAMKRRDGEFIQPRAMVAIGG